ncbi:hypothetical protein JW930_00965 [Candidatus Woesearchaeota archaeon]|nr:hypothetical protein [Candidatus Woesearchaeota archaeon]
MQRKVRKVIDGYTFEVSPKIGKSKYVRLAGIKTHGKKAYNKLKELIEGKTVTIIPKGKSYDRVCEKFGED